MKFGTKRSKVLDSWGLMALFQDEKPAAGKMEDILTQAHETGLALMITTINLGEIWYSTARVRSATEADERVTDVVKLGIEVVSADWALAREAARFKSRGKLSYADCFALALAKWRKAELVTGDVEFKPFDGEVKIIWL